MILKDAGIPVVAYGMECRLRDNRVCRLRDNSECRLRGDRECRLRDNRESFPPVVA